MRKPRVVLVNLMDDHYKEYSNRHLSQPPLCLGVLAMNTPDDVDVTLLDEQVDQPRFEGDVFAFSVTTQLAKKSYAAADRLRQQGKKVVLGGYHVSVCPHEAARHADSIIVGEAETVWPLVCADIVAGALKPRYAGTPTPPEAMRPIDPAVYGARQYAFPGALYGSRGCVYACSFCGSSRLLGGYRRKALSTLEHEIDLIRQRHGDVVLQFTDDNPLADKAWRTGLLELVRRKKARFMCQITVDQLCDTQLVDELARSGCVAVAAGIESLFEQDVKAVNKMQNLGRPIADAVRHLTSKGIQIAALLIYGLENDTPERIKKSIAHLRAIPFSVYDAGVLRPFPGTGLYFDMIKDKKTVPQWWLKPESIPTNDMLPGYLRVYFNHPHFSAQGLQRSTIDAIDRLNHVSLTDALNILRTGVRGRNLWFAIKVIVGRWAVSLQARRWRRMMAENDICNEATCAPHEGLPDTAATLVRPARTKTPLAQAKPGLAAQGSYAPFEGNP